MLLFVNPKSSQGCGIINQYLVIKVIAMFLLSYFVRTALVIVTVGRATTLFSEMIY